MPTVNLCNKCYRPLWENLCAYCKGYNQGVTDTKKRKINEEIFTTKKAGTSTEDTLLANK